MKKNFVYLASASPRRAEILSRIGVPFERRPADVDESPLAGEAPERLVQRLAEDKAEAVWRQLPAAEPRPVLAADTLVLLDGALLGKPVDRDDALHMLEALAARTHTVLTAVAVRSAGHAASCLNATRVSFRATTHAEREAYCDTGEPFDKAGAYGIQGFGSVFVEHIEGSYSSVMGLPVVETVELLRRFGLPAWLDSERAA